MNLYKTEFFRLDLFFAPRSFTTAGTPNFPSPQIATFSHSNSTRNLVEEQIPCRCITFNRYLSTYLIQIINKSLKLKLWCENVYRRETRRAKYTHWGHCKRHWNFYLNTWNTWNSCSDSGSSFNTVTFSIKRWLSQTWRSGVRVSMHFIWPCSCFSRKI